MSHGAIAVDAQRQEGESQADAQVQAKIPWHFWVMVVAASIYLGWRVIQGLMALL